MGRGGSTLKKPEAGEREVGRLGETDQRCKYLLSAREVFDMPDIEVIRCVSLGGTALIRGGSELSRHIKFVRPENSWLESRLLSAVRRFKLDEALPTSPINSSFH